MTHSDPQAAPVPSAASMKPWLVFVVGVIALVVFVIHAQAEEAKHKADARTRFQMASAQVKEMVARATYRQPGGDLQPAVQWSGANATILHIDYEFYKHVATPDVHEWTVFARTQRGKFFEVIIDLDDDEMCTPARVVECSHERSFHPIPDHEAKAWVYALKDAKLYRQLFNKDMPPLEVPA